MFHLFFSEYFKMIEFDNILNELDQMTRPQWVQLMLLTLPCLIVATHMGAMVYLGADQPHTCIMPMQDLIIEACGGNWTEDQTEKYIPWDADKNALDSCNRYTFTEIDCNYWWPNMTFDTNQSSVTGAPSPSGVKQCSAWTFDTSVFNTTVVSEFRLVCESRFQRRFAQAIFMLGVALGCIAWGQVSDRFGRKLGIIGPLVLGFFFALSTAFVNSFIVFASLRFFVGFCVFPAFVSTFVLATETVKTKYRVWVGQSAQASFAVGFCLLALLGYYIRDWRNLQLAITIPIVAIVVILWFLFESPRWLISSKKYVIADKIVKRIIDSGKNLYSLEAEKLENIAILQRSGKETEDLEEEKLDKKQQEKDEEAGLNVETGTKTSYSIMDALRLPNMRKKSLILFYEWMVASCMYYGLTLNAADLGGDPFINLFLAGLIEIPAVYLSIVLLEKWGRRPTLVFSLLFGGVACILMLFVTEELVWMNILLSLTGKFCSAAAFGTVYIFATEIYPTPVRNVGLGVCSSWARIGGILAPFIAMLDAVAAPLPYVVFGLLSIIGGFLAFLLPEVLGIKLPETLEEGEAFGKDQKLIFLKICGRKKKECCGPLDDKQEYAKIPNMSSTAEMTAITDIETAV